MKRQLLITAALILLFASFFVTPASAAQHTKVTVDGHLLQFDVPPAIVEGRTLVPLRGIFEALGAEIHWNNDTRTVTGTKDDTTVVLQIGSRFPTVNNVPVEIDVPGTLVDGRTMVPARFIAESLNANVEWISESRTVAINSQAVQANEVAPPPAVTPAPTVNQPTIVAPQTGSVNINTAGIEELKKIIHIDEERAEQIIRLRPFRSVDDMTRINGIAEKRLAEIKAEGVAYVE
ncbi:stalk domain-containing protein [Anoxynatronum buryatiense]|uniref:Helix-hairpin-helix motif-containing protein n=1 Tax=Anoxynatronum buryatiense TaxID=489973 RepID=A0AA45WXH8_9CLOT|nr:stalk domain-containing protein [Anoxynatronum buryatiense]SMP64183.1 Helix-hairpin-helix motif-containing protein [Anoxynatronum buryatiense]